MVAWNGKTTGAISYNFWCHKNERLWTRKITEKEWGKLISAFFQPKFEFSVENFTRSIQAQNKTKQNKSSNFDGINLVIAFAFQTIIHSMRKK